jgi:hypothetical protein
MPLPEGAFPLALPFIMKAGLVNVGGFTGGALIGASTGVSFFSTAF